MKNKFIDRYINAYLDEQLPRMIQEELDKIVAKTNERVFIHNIYNVSNKENDEKS